ncbi:hypothetical protein TGAM01_v204796 [Trichoderma gamsii]|uniref:Uncharacterized protein n=1 Tax=Trichoderma gamsii TaxID=398673 RepID=A0A2P4ZPT8_9HYPO|nr:hypothetical protein TGAM01_v204796 [Trichoderma gamsii]PON26320.1 hypothetical protein TGAM01_v204796 [Trichoderma gamsii]
MMSLRFSQRSRTRPTASASGLVASCYGVFCRYRAMRYGSQLRVRSAGKPVRDVPGLYFGYGFKPPSGVGGQLSAESPCGHPGHSAGAGLGWLSCSPVRGVTWQVQGHKYPLHILAALLARLLLSSLALSFLNHLTTPDLGPSDRSSPPVKRWFSPPRRPKPRRARTKALWRRYFGSGIAALSAALYPIAIPGCVSICINCAAAS